MMELTKDELIYLTGLLDDQLPLLASSTAFNTNCIHY